MQNKLRVVISTVLLGSVIASACGQGKNSDLDFPPAKPGAEVNNSWKNVSNYASLDFSSQKEDLEVPTLAQEAGQDSLDKAVDSCEKQYKVSLEELDSSIADVAVSREYSEPIAIKMGKRVREVMEADAELRVEKSGKDGSSSDQDKGSAVQAEFDSILKSTVGACSVNDSGCLGNDPKRIRAALDDGNLRERMFFIFKSVGYFIGILHNTEYLNQVNTKLSQKGWQILTDFTVVGNVFAPGIYVVKGRENARVATSSEFRNGL